MYLWKEKERSGPQGISKLGDPIEEHKGSSDVGVKPEENGFRKVAIKVFEEGRVEGSLPLNLPIGDT